MDCAKLLLKANCDAGRLTDGGLSAWALAEQGGRTCADVVAVLQKYASKGAVFPMFATPAHVQFHRFNLLKNRHWPGNPVLSVEASWKAAVD
eukprot:SAG31_NODE_21140_length_557_cov_0.685590_1_plen_91_part_10